MNKTHLAMVTIISLLSTSCVTSDTSVQSGRISYGNTQKQVVSALGKKQVPLFRVLANGVEYYSLVYETYNPHEKFVFLYQNSILVSVIRAESAKKLWESTFHGFYEFSLPNPEKFDQIIYGLIHQKLDVSSMTFDTVYRTEPVRESAPSTRTEKDSATRGVDPGLIIMATPMYQAAFVAAAPLLPLALVLAAGKTADEFTTSTAVHKLALGSSKQDALSSIGKVEHKIVDGAQEILVFVTNVDRSAYFSLGFVQDQLKWVGYYFDAQKIYERQQSMREQGIVPELTK